MNGVPSSKYYKTFSGYKSFSGTDTIAFLMFPGIQPIVIGSLTTISYSMYRNKVPVINIGRTNINGIARGSRIYAGTMVFTLINKHWLRELQDNATYLSDYKTMKVDELPLFDIMVVSANEYGNSCSMFIYGIDFTDEAQTVSVEDLFTENVFKFVARDVSVFDENIITTDGVVPKDTAIIREQTIENSYSGYEQNINNYNKQYISRTLYYDTSNKLMSEDVARVQAMLNNIFRDANLTINYTYDKPTYELVRRFQSLAGIPVDGNVDNNTFVKMLEYTDDNNINRYAIVINKSGANVYDTPSIAGNVAQVLPYLSSVEIIERVKTDTDTFYKTQNGYIAVSNIFDYDNPNLSNSFDIIKMYDNNHQVTVLQNMLEQLYPSFEPNEYGYFDETTRTFVLKYQREHNYEETGYVNQALWQELLIHSNYSSADFEYKNNITYSVEPGSYSVTIDDLSNYTVTINNTSTQQVKYSCVAVYNDGTDKTDAKVIVFKGEKTISLTEMENMFDDDIKHLKPRYVEYIVYPYGDVSLKWHFNLL